MITNLSILNSSGDIKIIWDHSKPDEVAKARAEVAELKSAGYAFYLLDGSPADEVMAGSGSLIVRRLKADEVVATQEDEGDPKIFGDAESSEPVEPVPTTSKRRGRPPKTVVGGTDSVSPVIPATPNVESARNIVAVRPVAGG